MLMLLEIGQHQKIPKMRVKYADSREERAVLVKTEHMLVVRRMIDFKAALDLKTCRHLLTKIDKAATSAQANHMRAVDSTSGETPKHLLKDLVKPKRKFNIAAITAHMTARKIGRPNSSNLPKQCKAMVSNLSMSQCSP